MTFQEPMTLFESCYEIWSSDLREGILCSLIPTWQTGVRDQKALDMTAVGYSHLGLQVISMSFSGGKAPACHDCYGTSAIITAYLRLVSTNCSDVTVQAARFCRLIMKQDLLMLLHMTWALFP